MGHRVFVTRRIPQAGLDLFEAQCESVEVNPEDRCLSHDELVEQVRGYDGILCMLTDRIDEAVLDAAKGARGFANCAVGYNNFDLEKATERGMVVTNTPGVLTDATADLTWALILAAARRIVESDRFLRAGKFDGWGPMMLMGVELAGATLGIVGMGRIGTAVARRAQGFGMHIVYSDPTPNDALEREMGGRRLSLNDLLQQADIVTLHVPLTGETQGMIGREALERMKPTAILVNTSRGPVVDEAALAESLRAGEIAAAALDVYENEPKVHSGLLGLDNAVLCPHIGSATVETRTRMAVMAARNLLAIVKGERAPNCVNPEVYGPKEKEGE